jgi:DNA-binding NtrC family response regulator
MPIGKYTLLLFEDVKSERETLERRFGKEGYAVTPVGKMEEAFASLEQKHFDIIVADMKVYEGMEEKEPQAGLTILRFMRQLQSPHHMGLDSVFIIYTGHPDYKECVAAIKAGAYGYILKPHHDELLRTCREGLKEQQGWATDDDAEFVRANWNQLFEKYGESWIAVRGREIIANASTLSEIYAHLNEHSPQARPYVVHLESAGTRRM